MSKKIPRHLILNFQAHMDAYNNDGLPDGAWFQVLEDAAEMFIQEHSLKGIDANDAVHYYLSEARQ